MSLEERVSLLENVIISLCKKLMDHGIYVADERELLNNTKKENEGYVWYEDDHI